MWNRSIGAMKLWSYTNNIPNTFKFSQIAWPSAPLFFSFSPSRKLATHIINSLPTNHLYHLAVSNISAHKDVHNTSKICLLYHHTPKYKKTKAKQNPSTPPKFHSHNWFSFPSLASPCLFLPSQPTYLLDYISLITPTPSLPRPSPLWLPQLSLHYFSRWRQHLLSGLPDSLCQPSPSPIHGPHHRSRLSKSQSDRSSCLEQNKKRL